MSEKLSTLETQELIYKRCCEEFKRNRGKSREQLLKEANTPKPEWVGHITDDKGKVRLD